MTLLNYIITQIKEYPFKSGLLYSGATSGFGLWGLMTNENTPRVIACIGGVLSIILALLSIYQKFIQIKKGSK